MPQVVADTTAASANRQIWGGRVLGPATGRVDMIPPHRICTGHCRPLVPPVQFTTVDTGDVDILAVIDAALGCRQCGGPLGDSPSTLFCSDDCQRAWHAARSDHLVGYQEPDDQFLADPTPRSSEFRLPRSTGNLRADWRAARRAEATATTNVQREAVRLRIRSLNGREHAASAEATDAMWPAMDAAMQRFRGLTERIAVARGTAARGTAGRD